MGQFRKEIENYNREIQEYNEEIKKYVQEMVKEFGRAGKKTLFPHTHTHTG